MKKINNEAQQRSPRKPKILIRIGSLRHGGAEKVLITLLKNLPADTFEIDLLLNLGSGKYLQQVPAHIKVIYLNKGEMITTNRLQDIPCKAFRVLYQALLRHFPRLLYSFILKNKKYDIEFAAIHGMRDEILQSPIHNSKKLVWIHNDLRKTEFHHYTDTEIRKFFGFDAILVISKQIEEDFLKLAKNNDEQKRIRRIYNPLDTHEILTKSKAELSPAHQSLQKNIPTFLAVGTVFPQKGFDRLLRAHKRLLNEGLKHQLLIVGDGYDMPNIQKIASELDVQDSAKLLGFVDNPYPIFALADFFVLSSRYEGFPTVLFEAIALSKNIIATDVSGVQEMLQNGKLGLIVDNSEKGIYLGMKQALETPNSFDTYQNTLANYQMSFDLENSVQSIQTILEELLHENHQN